MPKWKLWQGPQSLCPLLACTAVCLFANWADGQALSPAITGIRNAASGSVGPSRRE